MPVKNRQANDTIHTFSGVAKAVTRLVPNAYLFPPPSRLQEPSLDPATIILAKMPFSYDRDLPKELQESSQIPILLVKEKDEPLPEFPKDSLVDLVELPISQEILEQKLGFLKNVYALAREHKAQLESHNKQLDFIYRYDSLTGLRNRREFTTDLKREMLLAADEDEDLTLFIFNIDLFNDLNKRLGLEFGDFVLNEMGARLTSTLKGPARCYRYSTEDFAALLPGSGLQEAEKLATRLLEACSEKPFCDTDHSVSLTLSLGMATYREHQPKDHEKFLFMAESALFNAKATGRDRAVVYLQNSPATRADQVNPLHFLKSKLSRILDKTRTSAITSLQHLAKSVAGTEHKKHVDQVVSYTDLLSEEMRLPKQLRQTFHNSITLYTSFRFLLHNDLLTKPGSLTREEWQIIEDLPFKIKELTDMFDYFGDERELLVCQGENYDGSGYPDGLKGNEIPIGARILKIVDSLAAMNGDRPYRRRLTPEEIIRELYHGAGKQFDPFLVLQTLSIIGKHKLLEVDPEYLAATERDLQERVKELLI